MKKIITLSICTLAMITSFSQKSRRENEIAQAAECGGIEELAKLKGTWKQVEDDLAFPDKTFPKSQYRQVYERVDKMLQLFKETITDLTGTEPRWYRALRGSSFSDNGPVPYSINTLYFNYYCNSIQKKPVLGDETRTWFHVFVNQYSWFCQKVDEWDINNDGKMIYIYRLPPKAGKWKGITVYEPDTHRGYSRAIVLGHNGKLPWHTLTKKQYLTGLKIDLETKKKNALAAQLKEQYRASNEKYWNDLLKPVTDYLANHSDDELKEPAIIDPSSPIITFNGKFGNESDGIKLVCFSTAYWNKDLPRYAPQFMILYWMWDGYIFAGPIKQQLEENFPVEKLKALIDK